MTKMENKSASYSGRNTTCHILGASGVMYRGVRIENISYPLTISSIQSAVCSCLGNGDTPIEYFLGDQEPELLDVWVKEYDLKPGGKFPQKSVNLYYPLEDSIRDFKEELIRLTAYSVIPNSDFAVSALLETDDGFIPGVNVETVSWALGLCAERVAISRALSAGYRDFKAIHLYAPDANFVSPCGACRQVLLEIMPNAEAELYHGDGTFSRHMITDFLPFGFTSHKLKR